MSNSNSWLSVIRKDKPQFFTFFFRHTFLFLFLRRSNFQVWNIDSEEWNSLPGFLKFLGRAVCETSSRVYFDELFRVLCQGSELIF